MSPTSSVGRQSRPTAYFAAFNCRCLVLHYHLPYDHHLSQSRKALHLTCLLNSGNLKLICFSSGSEYSSLSVCSLSEQRNVISTAKDFFSTFEEWSRAHSLLKIARLTTCAVPEQVEQIESVVIGGKKTYLSVTCAHHVMVYEVPVAQSSAASCRWIRNPVTHKFPSKILHTKLRY